jgi:hypothetical protein
VGVTAMTFSVLRHLAGKKVRAGDVLQPEPPAFWQKQITLSGGSPAGEPATRQPDDEGADDQFMIRYCPLR